MAELVNAQPNKLEPVADADVSDALASRKYRVPGHLVSEDGVELVRPDGEIVDVPLEYLHDALAPDKGYKFESRLAKEASELEKDYTGFLPALGAFAAGGLQGFTGVATPILEAVGVDVGALETFQPGSYIGGEVIGTGAALFGTGGTTKLLGGGLGLGLKQVAKGGLVKGGAKFAESTATKFTAKMAEKTFGQKLMKKAAAGAVEGTIDAGLYGVQRTVHDLSLERSELTGQNVAAVVKQNLLVTPLVGGAFGGTINALGFPVVQAMKKASGPAKKILAAAMPITTPKAFNTAEEFLVGVAEEAGYEALGPMLNAHRAVSRREAANPGWHGRAKKWFNETTTSVDGAQKPLFDAGDTWEDITPKIEAEKERLGNAIQGFYAQIDELNTPLSRKGVDGGAIIAELEKLRKNLPDAASKAVRNEVNTAITTAKKTALKEDLRGWKVIAEDLQQLGARTGFIKKLKNYADFRRLSSPQAFGNVKLSSKVIEKHLDNFFDSIMLDLDDLGADEIERIYRSTTDAGELLKMSIPNSITSKNVYWGQSKFEQARPKDVSLINRDFARIWRDEADDAAERIIKMGEDLGGDTKTSMGEFKRLKDDFGYAETFHGIVADRAGRAQVNRKMSPTDYLFGATGVGMGIAGGGAVGGAVGGAIGAASNRFLRERGLSYTAAGARSLAKLGIVQDGTVDAIVKRTRDIAQGTVSKAKFMDMPLSIKGLTQITFTGETPKGDTEQEVIEDLIGQINTVASDPEKFAAQMSSELRELEIIAPDVAAQAALTKGRMVQFLADNSPKEEMPYNKLQPRVYDKAHLTPEAIAKFKRYLKVALDPANTLLSEIGAGTVMMETMQGISFIYPALLDEIRVKNGEAEAESNKVKNNSELASLAKVYETAIVPYQSTGFMRRQQAQYKVASEGSMGGVPKSSAAQGTTAMNTQTAMNAVQSNLKRG